MANGPHASVLRRLRRLAGASPADGTDSHLLARFVDHRDEEAFAALLVRHGPLVRGVCRQVLRDAHEADDAFQATFLVLARKARSIRQGQCLAAWLYRVAYHIAVQAVASLARRRSQNGSRPLSNRPGPEDELLLRELHAVLHEEVNRLPARYRLPVILSYFEGRTNEETARELGWPVGTVKTRLNRARELLRARLVQRGLSVSAGVLLAALPPAPLTAAVPAPLCGTALNAARLVAAGQPLAANGVSTAVLSLANAALKTAALSKTVLVVTLLALGVLAFSQAVKKSGSQEVEKSGVREEAPLPDFRTSRLPGFSTSRTPGEQPRVDPFGDALPPGALARLGTLRLRHAAAVDVLAFSPDGQLLAASSRDGALGLWDTTTGKEVRRLSGECHQISSLAFSPDGRLLACAEASRPTVRIWDVRRTRDSRPNGERPALRGHTGSVRKVAFASAHTLASAGSDGTLRLWDVRTGREVRQLGVLGSESGTFALAPDGRTLAWCGPAGNVRLWDLQRGAPLRRLAEPPGRVDHLDFSSDGTRLSARDARGTGCCWEVRTGLLLSRRSADASARVPLASDGPFVLALRPDGRLGVTDCLANKDLCTLQGEMNGLSSFTVSADRQTVALGSLEGVITLWDVASGLEVMPLEGHQGRVSLVGFTPDGRQLITAGTDHSLRLWDPATGQPLGRIDDVDGPFALSPDARILAATGSDNQVRLWDLTTARLVALCERPQGMRGLTGLAFSPNGRVLAAVLAANPFGHDGDPAVCLWKVATGAALTVLPWRPGLGRTSVTFAPDGKELVTADGDVVRLWDPSEGAECWSLRNFSGRGGSVAFAPDGTLLAVADHGHNTVRLCRPLTGEIVAQFEYPAESASGVLAVAFSPDGKLLATAGADGTVRVWETATLRQQDCYRGHRAPAETLAFSPDGRLLVSGSRDTTVLVWAIRSPPAHKPCRPLPHPRGQ